MQPRPMIATIAASGRIDLSDSLERIMRNYKCPHIRQTRIPGPSRTRIRTRSQTLVLTPFPIGVTRRSESSIYRLTRRRPVYQSSTRETLGGAA